MTIKQYDDVKTKDGYDAVIVEVFSDTVFIADIDYQEGTETQYITIDDIERIQHGVYK